MWYEHAGRQSNVFSSNPFKMCRHFSPRVSRINCFSTVTNIYLWEESIFLGHRTVWSMNSVTQTHGWRSEITVFHDLIEENISLNVIAFSNYHLKTSFFKWQHKLFCKQSRQTLLLFLKLLNWGFKQPPSSNLKYYIMPCKTFCSIGGTKLNVILRNLYCYFSKCLDSWKICIGCGLEKETQTLSTQQ